MLYPNNNWIDQLIKPSTMNQRFNANLSGGGRVARFYLAGTFNIDNGVLRNDNKNDFKNNISLKNYSIRSNTDLQLTKTTVATVRVYAQFDDYKGPIGAARISSGRQWPPTRSLSPPSIRRAIRPIRRIRCSVAR